MVETLLQKSKIIQFNATTPSIDYMIMHGVRYSLHHGFSIAITRIKESNSKCDVLLSNPIFSLQDFTINAFIEQEWCDPRLIFYGMIMDEYFELDSKFMVRVWVPDLYFTNEKRANFHVVTVPNKMLHLYNNGCIKYRLR